MIEFDLIADNAGGLLIQTNGYCHYYQDRDGDFGFLEDIYAILDGENTDSWEGNDIEEIGIVNFDPEIERNGGYKWYNQTDICDFLALDITNSNSLKELCDNLNRARAEVIKDYVDMSSLPIFEGADPENTVGIFSWDENSFLVQDQEGFVLISREKDD